MGDNDNRWSTEAVSVHQRGIVVDRAKCVGSGQCLIAAAEYFAQDDQGYVLLLPPASQEDLFAREDVREAVANCPSRALSWRPREGS